jgi:hypothetical protein
MHTNERSDWQRYDPPERRQLDRSCERPRFGATRERRPRDRHPYAAYEKQSEREAWFDVPDWQRGAHRASELRRGEHAARDPRAKHPRFAGVLGESSRLDDGSHSSRKRTDGA